MQGIIFIARMNKIIVLKVIQDLARELGRC
jgi:hypothetical protein